METKEQVRLAIIDYGMGNLHSVQRAWEHVGAQVELIEEPERLDEAWHGLVFPGQGAIVDAMQRLADTGFDRVIRDWVSADRPFFGICLGLQALFEHSEEGDTPGLGIFPGRVRRFRFPDHPEWKVPHMGWNTVSWRDGVSLSEPFAGREEAFYFVHSYYVEPADPSLVWGHTQYGDRTFCCAIAHGRCYATQFHPEKSQAAGLRLYRSFVESLAG